ncbi:EFNA1 protein, partial [Polypterus senegalus]|nr:ephrin-A1-like [Polypterus senegalus]MBN3290039.1 EFNA1 protein [Polypterus senegalus]
MDLLWIVCLTTCFWIVSAERHSVYWNSSNPKFLWDDYTVAVRINDYLDIICPHYEEGEIPSHSAERYILYMVEAEEYDTCKPQSKDQVRWECNRPLALNGPEKFSEKFQRYTPFTLGKEFREGETYYYISKPIHHHGEQCLKLKVKVVGQNGSQQPRTTGAHTPGLPADDPAISAADVMKSIGHNSHAPFVPVTSLVTLLSVLCVLLL